MDALATKISGKIYTVDDNNLNLQNISFSFMNDVFNVMFQTGTASYHISFGAGKWQAATTNMPGPSLHSPAIENNISIDPHNIAGI